MYNSSDWHVDEVNHILAYLKSSPRNGILFSKHMHLDIMGYTDVNFIGSKIDR